MIYTSDLLTTDDMKHVLSQTNTGIESIEFSISENLEHLDTKIFEYRNKLDALQITDLTIHGPFLDLNPVSWDSGIREISARRFAQSYDAALQLGAKKIIFHTCYISMVHMVQGWPQMMANFWNRFLETRTEIPVLLENVYDPSPEPIREIKDLVDAPNFSLCLDIGHVNCYSKIPIQEWLDCFGDTIGHVHVHDNDGSRDAHLALGEGSLPITDVLTALQKNAPKATYTIECASPEAVLKSFDVLRHFMTVPIPITTRTTCSE